MNRRKFLGLSLASVAGTLAAKMSGRRVQDSSMIPTRDAPTKPLGVKPQGIVHPNTYKELAKSGQSHGLTSSCEVTHTRSSIDIKYVNSEFRQVLHDTSVTAMRLLR